MRRTDKEIEQVISQLKKERSEISKSGCHKQFKAFLKISEKIAILDWVLNQPFPGGGDLWGDSKKEEEPNE